MFRQHKIWVFILFFVSLNIHSEDNRDYSEVLKEKSDLYLKNSKRKVIGAPQEFIRYLQETNKEYHELSLSQWEKSLDIFLDIIQRSDQFVYWDDFLVRVNICNKLFGYVLDYIEKNKFYFDANDFEKTIEAQKKIRVCFPSYNAIFHIVSNHYNYKTTLVVDSFSLKTPVYNQGENINTILQDIYRNNQKKIIKNIKEEKEKLDIGYNQLYQNPKPWHMFKAVKQYFDFSWRLYLYTQFLKKYGGNFDNWESVTEEELREFLLAEYNSENKFWMTSDAVKSVERIPAYLKNYLAFIQRGQHISIIKHQRKASLENKPYIQGKFHILNLP